MKNIFACFAAGLCCLVFSQEAVAIPVNTFNIPTGYEKLFAVTNVNVASCGSGFHTGPAMIDKVPDTAVGTKLFDQVLLDNKVDVASIFFDLTKDAFVDQGGGLFHSNTSAGPVRLGGFVDDADRERLLTGNFRRGTFDIIVDPNGVDYGYFQAKLNVTDGAIFDLLGGDTLPGATLLLYVNGTFNISLFNGKDFISSGTLRFFGPGSETSQVPEPSSGLLLLLSAVFGQRRLRARQQLQA